MLKIKKWIAALLFAALFITFAYAGGDLLMPPRTEYGCMWKSYLQEDKNTIDVLFCGSSLVYCDVIPAQIWKNTGLTSYVVAGPEQTIPISYYYLREACRTQSPKAIFLEVSMMYYNKYQRYTQTNISYMPWSLNRLAATLNAAEEERKPGLLFPLFDYHGRIYDLSLDEIRQNLNPEKDVLAGYTLLTENAVQKENRYRDFKYAESNYENNLSYLNKLSDFCRQQNIKLFFYVAPCKLQINKGLMARLKADLYNIPNAGFEDFNDCVTEMGLSDTNDWYNRTHLNITGAKKFTDILGGYISEKAGISPGGKADLPTWNERAEFIDTK